MDQKNSSKRLEVYDTSCLQAGMLVGAGISGSICLVETVVVVTDLLANNVDAALTNLEVVGITGGVAALLLCISCAITLYIHYNESK